MLFLDPSGDLYTASVAFAMGETRANLVAWWSHACTMMFWLLIEVSTERQHALGKKGIAKAHRHSEPYFSLALRSPLIERALEDEPASLSVLGELAESVLHYSGVISLFRLFLR